MVLHRPIECTRLTGQEHSVLGQKFVVKLHRRLPYPTLFGEAATLKADVKPIVTVGAEKIEQSDIRILEASLTDAWTAIAKKLAQFSEAVYGTRTEAELLSTRLAGHVNAEVIKTVIAIKAHPFKSYLRRGVFETDFGVVPHGQKV
jgi:hypothetical protein